jgi:hypothetical protein
MTDLPASYVRRRISADGSVTEQRVVDGVVVGGSMLPITSEPQQIPQYWTPTVDPLAEVVAQAAADFFVDRWNAAMASAKAALAQAMQAIRDAE